MSRAASGDIVIVKPSSNVYTVLVAISTIATGLALLVVWLRGSALGIF
jgi:hypothetical protein